jgi:hypothetical protein
MKTRKCCLLSLLLCLLVLITIPNIKVQAGDAATSEEKGYYDEETEEYEYEYEDVALENVMNSEGEAQFFSGPIRETFYGFHVNVGGGLMTIKKPLVDEAYLNETAVYYDCIKRADAWILALEPNNTDVEDEFDIMQQIATMKKKVDQAVAAANNIADSLSNGTKPNPQASSQQNNSATVAADKASDSAVNTTEKVADSRPKPKRLSFREKQDMRMKMRREKEQLREQQRPKFRLGASCETLLCGSCKAVVNEFAGVVHRAVNSSEIHYIEQLLSGFCASKEISLKYNDMVADICGLFQEETLGYKEALVMRFEAEEDWEGVSSRPRILQQQKAVCNAIGACTEEQFSFQSEPLYRSQEQWDEKCFVCQAFAIDLEERVQLTRHVTERNIVPIVAETCDRLVRLCSALRHVTSRHIASHRIACWLRPC